MLSQFTVYQVKLPMILTPLPLIWSNVSSTNPHFKLMIGNFNAKLSNWPCNNTTTAEGAQLDYLTSSYGMKQVIIYNSYIYIYIYNT